MGNDLHVRWTDGPTEKQVDAIIQKYSSGSFDGMTDYYNYSQSTWTDAFGKAKYVFSQREYSAALIGTIINQLAIEYAPAQAPTVDDFNQGRAWNTRIVV